MPTDLPLVPEQITSSQRLRERVHAQISNARAIVAVSLALEASFREKTWGFRWVPDHRRDNDRVSHAC